MKHLFFVFLMMPAIIWASEDNELQFFKGSLTGAKEKAMVEGKLYFIDFVANYCYMCKMMDETTFRDESVIGYVENNYIPVKINVDDFDGYVWKLKYKIRVLPTIMVFNSAGEVVGRYEESMGSARLLEILKKHNLPQNRTKFEVTATSPEPTEPSQPIATPAPVSPPATNPQPAVVVQENQRGEGLFEFSVKRRNEAGFGIQVGVFQDYANVLQEVASLDAKFDKPILVHITRLNEQLAYRVIVGTFQSRSAAEAYHQNEMKRIGVNGFVKDISPLL